MTAQLSNFEGYQNISIVYKEVDGIQLKLDVLYPSNKPSSPVPVVIHYHGGFLVLGDRYSVLPYWLVNACVNRGWIFVTPDFRLIPEITAHECVLDAADAYKWVLNSLKSHIHIDVGPVTLAGSSAGAYLALVTSLLTDQCPAALLLIYGLLDPANERYITKGKNLFGHPLFDTKPVLERLALIREKGPFQVLCGYPWPEDLGQDPRYAIVTTLHIEALVPDFHSGVPGLSERIHYQGVEAIPDQHRYLFPLSFGLHLQLPPTIFIHGKNDAAVPFILSQNAAEELRRTKTEVYAEFPEDAQHGFDALLGPVDLEKDESSEFKTPACQSLRNVISLLNRVMLEPKGDTERLP